MSCAISEKAPCVCDPCCRGILIPADFAAIPPVVGSVLVAELLYDGVGCFEVGATQELIDSGASMWTSPNAFMGNIAWKGLLFECGWLLAWEGAGCPIKPGSPGDRWELISGSCSPFRFVFEVHVNEAVDGTGTGCNECNGQIGAPGLQGTLRVQITIKP